MTEIMIAIAVMVGFVIVIGAMSLTAAVIIAGLHYLAEKMVRGDDDQN